MSDAVKAAAQEEAEVTFDAFILWTKRITMYAAIFLGVVVFGCNSGVETGKSRTGSQYNGEQYSPTNLNDKN